MDKLNLGCGFQPKAGFINVDISEHYPADLFHDLNISPWPLPSDHFDLVEADHVLEHLSDLRATLAEVYRVLTIGGVFRFRVPHFSRGFTHWDHKRGFDVSFPIYFQEGTSGRFEGIYFEHLKTQITWFAQPEIKKQFLGPISYTAGSIGGVFFDFIGNLNLYFTSRILCYWVGGYEELLFEFRKSASP